MIRIGIISDTHGLLRPEAIKHLAGTDHIIHAGDIGAPEEAALAWYRARGDRQPIGPTKVPTLFLWGDADDTVGRISAEGTSEFIAADYRFAALPGVGHYAADQVPAQVNALLLQHLAGHPV